MSLLRFIRKMSSLASLTIQIIKNVSNIDLNHRERETLEMIEVRMKSLPNNVEFDVQIARRRKGPAKLIIDSILLIKNISIQKKVIPTIIARVNIMFCIKLP